MATLYVQTPSSQTAEKYAARYRAGVAPDESPYGLHMLEEYGWKIIWSRAPSGWLGSRISRLSIRILGLDLWSIATNYRKLLQSDVAYAHTDAETLTLCAAKMLLARKTPSVRSNVIWLPAKLIAPKRGFQAKLHARLLRRADMVFVNSTANLEALRHTVPGLLVSYVKFGAGPLKVAGHVAAPSAVNRDATWDVAIIGNDRARDWALVGEIIRRHPGRRIRVASPSISIATPGPNVVAGPATSLAEIVAIYKESRLIAVPTQPNLHASGITVILEAASMGRPVVASWDPSLEDYFPDGAVCYVRDGSRFPDELSRLIDTDGAAFSLAARYVEDSLTRKGFIARLHSALIAER